MKRDLWNRCDVCGRFVGMSDFASGAAARWMETPDSDFSVETWATRCPEHHPVREPEDPMPRPVLP